jgi:hypothetical protein
MSSVFEYVDNKGNYACLPCGNETMVRFPSPAPLIINDLRISAVNRVISLTPNHSRVYGDLDVMISFATYRINWRVIVICQLCVGHCLRIPGRTASQQ